MDSEFIPFPKSISALGNANSFVCWPYPFPKTVTITPRARAYAHTHILA